MGSEIFFEFSNYWWFYAAFLLFVILMLTVDLGIFHRKEHTVTVKESLIWTCIWIALALLFNGGLYYYALHMFQTDPQLIARAGFDATAMARQLSLEFLTGFVIEKSLAIDNIFVFVVIFNYFAIPAIYQHRVLFYGIVGALIFRAIFIAAGASLLQYHWFVVIAGFFLIATGIKILVSPEKIPDPGSNPLIGFVRKFVPIHQHLEGKNFFTSINGVWHATPLFLALVFIEFSDIIFAIDSVPAIFAITNEPLIVFTSNIFAILGLRSLYFLLAGIVDQFRFLKYGLGLILIFVGAKMTWLNQVFDGKFPINWSLGIICFILVTSIVSSIVIGNPKLKKPDTK